MTDNSFNEFEEMFNELGDKKIGELRLQDIAKYLLLAEELNWIDANVGDDKVFYKYDKELLETLSYSLVSKDLSTMFTNKERKSIKILSPLTEERAFLRQSLITSLYKIYE